MVSSCLGSRSKRRIEARRTLALEIPYTIITIRTRAREETVWSKVTFSEEVFVMAGAPLLSDRTI